MLLKTEFDKMEALIPQSHFQSDEVSQKGIDWHLDHSFKVINGVCTLIRKPKTEKYRWKFNLPRAYCFVTNGFPRGKGKAPEVVTNDSEISREDLLKELKVAREFCADFESLPRNSYFDHPIFGHLHRRSTRKFLKIHTQHHLKIISEIIEANNNHSS